MTKIKDLHAKWMTDKEYRKEYEALEEEFALAQAIIEAHVKAGLESGSSIPSARP